METHSMVVTLKRNDPPRSMFLHLKSVIFHLLVPEQDFKAQVMLNLAYSRESTMRNNSSKEEETCLGL